MDKKYLTEENYQKSNKKVKTIGTILLVIGLILLVGGFITMISGFLGFGNQVIGGMENPNNAFSNFSSFAVGGLMMGPGLFLTAIGFFLRVILANRREITAYTTQQVMPIAKEGIEEMAPTIGKAAGEIAKGIKNGLK